jgi:cytochrome P450
VASVASPPPYKLDNPLRKVASDVWTEVKIRRHASMPPGLMGPNPMRDLQMLRDPVSLMLPAYERFGPVFSMRAAYAVMVIALGPEAQHHILVEHPEQFHWREGLYRELIPFIGDGLITTDDDYHDRSRRLMLPVFHTERLAAATRVMVEEVDKALDAWWPGKVVDVYEWARQVGMRVAMRALFGFDPDAMHAAEAAHEFERGLSFYGRTTLNWLIRGPGTPYAHMRASREHLAALVSDQIARRRRGAADGGGEDILSLLMHAEDEDGWRFSDEQLLDHTLTLLFAGHDTTTTTLAVLMYELARHPEWRDRVVEELEREAGEAPPSEEQLFSGLPVMEQVLDETLRLYPPVPAGLRRTMQDVEIAGQRVPEGCALMYMPWVSHRLADVFEDPHAFRPERMTREEKAKLPKGAYVPFGGGRRICIGKRFGYLEAKVIATRVLQRFRPELEPGARLRIRWAATLVPHGGIPMRIKPR